MRSSVSLSARYDPGIATSSTTASWSVSCSRFSSATSRVAPMCESIATTAAIDAEAQRHPVAERVGQTLAECGSRRLGAQTEPSPALTVP